MSTCRISLFGLALTLLTGSAGLCQPPHPMPAANFKYAHTAYPTTSYPATTSANSQSEWVSDKGSQLQDTPTDRSVAKNGEAAEKTGTKSGSGGMSSFRKWFSRSSERPSKNSVQQSPITKGTTPAKKDPAPRLVSPPPSASTRASGANLSGGLTQSENSTLSGVAKHQSVLTDPRSSVEPSGGSRSSSRPSSKNSVTAAFGGILPEDPPREDVRKVKTVQATTAKPEKIVTANAITPLSLPSSAAEQAVVKSPVAENPLHRPKIIFQPVAGGVDSRGNAMLRPSVQVAAHDAIPAGADEIQLAQFAAEEGNLPVPPQAQQAPEMVYPVDDEWMPPVVADGECCDCEGGGGFGHHMHGHGLGHGHGQGYAGVGREYVMHAPFFVDTSQPYNNCRIRGDAARNWEFPDRAEYFWSKTPGPKGPRPDLPAEPSVNYQDIAFFIEKGGERFSIGTNIPIRSVDPEVRSCTTGLADMEVTSKIVLIDGCRFQLTQIFSTHLPTGSFRRGTGNGHVSLEPGIAYRYKLNDDTYFHGDLTYLFPVGADPLFSGQFLNYGIALSHVWIDADTYSLIPTIEIDAWTVLDGRQSLPGLANFDPGDPVAMPPIPPSATFEEIDSMGIVNVHPGLRWVCDKGGDCGVKTFGISSGICVTEDSWYEEILRIEFRWNR
jgi:hypothetical protein